MPFESRVLIPANTQRHRTKYDERTCYSGTEFIQTNLLHSPGVRSSMATSSLRSGSSPYQKIHNSLAAAKLRGGGCVGGGGPRSNKLAACGADTLRQTQRMSAAKQRAQLRSTGSSRGSPLLPPPLSHHTSLRHLMPESSVWKNYFMLIKIYVHLM